MLSRGDTIVVVWYVVDKESLGYEGRGGRGSYGLPARN